MGRYGFGQAVPRTEDPRLLTGRGRFLADVEVPGAAHAQVVRAPYAHAVVRRIDAAAARDVEGVLAVLTGADAAADRLGAIPCLNPPRTTGERPAWLPPTPVLAGERVRHVGEPVVLVVAETLAAAADAAERVEIDYEPLPAVTEVEAALDADSPRVWDEAPDNLAFDWETGDAAAVEQAMAAAAHRVSLRLVNNRLIANAIEPRGAIGAYDRESDRYTLWTGTQTPHAVREALAGSVFGSEPERVRVVVSDVGGGFGTKNSCYPEQALVLWAARRLGRPVRWIAGRTESFVADHHARDNVWRAELGLDAEGRFLALSASSLANIGAYGAMRGSVAPVVFAPVIIGPYRTPAAHVRVRGVLSHTPPTDVYRGAGRPEAVYVMERLVDAAARQLGLEPAELRRRNLVQPDELPWSSPLGYTYDSGDFPGNLETALAATDHANVGRRRAEARRRGRLHGFGLASYLDTCAGGGTETPRVRVDAGGRVSVLVASQTNGQGHATAFSQLVAEALGLEPEAIEVVQGDTDRTPVGRGCRRGPSRAWRRKTASRRAARTSPTAATSRRWRSIPRPGPCASCAI